MSLISFIAVSLIFYKNQIKYLYLGKGRYFLSKETNNTYRVKKRSITRNSNVIFTLKFNPIDHIDDGLKKLEDTLMQGI